MQVLDTRRLLQPTPISRVAGSPHQEPFWKVLTTPISLGYNQGISLHHLNLTKTANIAAIEHNRRPEGHTDTQTHRQTLLLEEGNEDGSESYTETCVLLNIFLTCLFKLWRDFVSSRNATVIDKQPQTMNFFAQSKQKIY